MAVLEVGCPYVGLRPYEDVDRDYFFGRRRDQRIISSNFSGASLTILYGATGVGKTSVLEAGVIPALRTEARTAVVAFRDWQGAAVATTLKTRCLEAVSAARAAPTEIDTALPLDEFLLAATRELGGPILLVLDQFEEYFLYHARPDAADAIDIELARSVNREDVDANFLIALREDSLARLDRFRGRIPSLRRNELRLRHLDYDAAREAILGPLHVYRERNPQASGPIDIEPDLVDLVLEQIRTGQDFFGTGGKGRAQRDGDAADIETPYLQLVLTKIWAAEVDAKSRVLRTQTFVDKLKGAREIVRRHLDEVLADLRPVQRDVCARIFDKLVTPSGSKIAYPEDDLAEATGKLATHVPSTLDTLTRKSILKPVPLAPDRRAFEIFHDVLARPILDWRRRYLQRQVGQRRIIAGIAVALVLGSFLAYREWIQWLDTRPWGSLADIWAGTVTPLTGDLAVVGRSTEDSRAQVDVPNPFVSRLHMTISRTFDITDVRSLNGTTVNASPLPYGKTRPLIGGDIIVLAGVAVLEFQPMQYARFQLWPLSLPRPAMPAGWGLLVDGSARRVVPLTAARHFLQLDAPGGLGLSEKQTAASLVAVRHRQQRDGSTALIIEDFADAFPLEVFEKDTERDLRMYFTGVVPSNREFAVPTSASFLIRGVPFQIVLLPSASPGERESRGEQERPKQ